MGAVSLKFISFNNNDTTDIGTHFFLNEPNNLASDGINWRFCKFSDNLFDYEQTGGDCDVLTAVNPDAAVGEWPVVFPNPATSFFYYNYSGFDDGRITITGQDGRTVLQTAANSNHRVDIPHLPAGIYNVIFNNRDWNKVAKLVVR